MSQTTQWAYFQGMYVPIEEAQVSVMTHALHYGTACFGGLRAYWNKEKKQLFVFRMKDHFLRFLQSAGLLLMEPPYTVEELSEITLALLEREFFREDCYIRPLAYKATKQVGVRLHDLEDELTIFALPFGPYIKKDWADVCVSSWRRIDDNAIPARGKIAGAYVNSALIKTEAALNGFDEGIVLNQDGHVAEGSAANLFIVRSGTLITPPVSANILEGITRSTVIDIAQAEFGIPTVERTIDRSELYIADEAFLCGTAVQVCPIASVDRRDVGNGRVGPITQKIRNFYMAIVRGRVPLFRHWCSPVY